MSHDFKHRDRVLSSRYSRLDGWFYAGIRRTRIQGRHTLMTDIPVAVAILALGFGVAGCGYDKSGNEHKLLEILDRQFPGARWGVECTDSKSSDGPEASCQMGFELRNLAHPTLTQLLEYAKRTGSFFDGGGFADAGGRNANAILPARLDAQGALHALDFFCSGHSYQEVGSLSMRSVSQGTNVQGRTQALQQRGCRLKQTSLTFSAVGR